MWRGGQSNGSILFPPVLGIEQTEGVPTFLVSHWLRGLATIRIV
jgi:hypothetical protein